MSAADASSDGPRAYRVAELAKRWQCSAASIYGMIRRGELKSFRFGSLLRVPSSEVERLDGQLPPRPAPTGENEETVDVPATITPERFYTLEEAATALRINSKTLSQKLNWLRRARPTDPLHARFGRKIIVSGSDLGKIYEALKVRPADVYLPPTVETIVSERQVFKRLAELTAKPPKKGRWPHGRNSPR